MSDVPKRIWVATMHAEGEHAWTSGFWDLVNDGAPEYIRADIHAAALAEVAELRKALGNSAMWFAILAAAVGDNIPKLRDECLLQEAVARAALK